MAIQLLIFQKSCCFANNGHDNDASIIVKKKIYNFRKKIITFPIDLINHNANHFVKLIFNFFHLPQPSNPTKLTKTMRNPNCSTNNTTLNEKDKQKKDWR